MDSKEIKSILVVQLARFGDFLQTTPLLAGLKKAFPEARLSVLVQTSQAKLALANPQVDEVLAVDLAALARTAEEDSNLGGKFRELGEALSFLDGKTFDWIVNLNTSRIAALLSELARSDRRSGPRLAEDRDRLITASWAVLIMNLMTDRRLIRFNLVDLLAGYAGWPSRVSDGLFFPLAESARSKGRSLLASGSGPVIGFQLGSRHPSRQWPPDRFALLAWEMMESLGARIVFLGLADERPLGDRVLSALNEIHPRAGSRIMNLMGRTGIEELAGVVAGLDLLVTTDTGTMHLAAALGTRILALFMGPALCHETGPYGRGHLIFQTMMDCSPCTEGASSCQDMPCRQLIRPEDVFEGAAWLLAGGRAPCSVSGPVSPQVQVLLSDFDDFGVVFSPVLPFLLDRTGLLALALREAGRRFLRPGYEPTPSRIQKTLSGFVLKKEPVAVLNQDIKLLERAWERGWPEASDLEWRRQFPQDLRPLAGILGDLFRSDWEIGTRFLADVREVVGLAGAAHESF